MIDPATLINIGKQYLNEGRVAEALPLLQSAVTRWPHIFLGQNYLADAYYLAGQAPTAIRHYEQALRLRPGDPDVLINLSVCHWQVGNFDAAHHCAGLARDRKPVNFGLLSLLLGDYQEGWKHWEFLDTARAVDLPAWQGETVKRMLILDEEQGFGDTILLARFLPLLAERCQHLTFQTRPPLLRLMQLSFPHIEVVTEMPKLDDFDCQVRLFSLPRLFHVQPDTVPHPPYLRADPVDRERWATVLSQTEGRKVGLKWAGSSQFPMDHLRSIKDISVLTPLRDVAGVRYVSLEKEVVAMPDMPMLTYELHDFADTAALLEALDLVISIDTGVINLAGALGLHAWLLDYHGMDWRWGIRGQDSPWYPTIKVYRQPQMNDWPSVIARVTHDLGAGCPHRVPIENA